MSATIDIAACTRREAEAWDGFLQSREDSSFYQLFAWKEINEQCFGHETVYLAARKEGRVVGVLPLVLVQSRLFGKILCSMPFVNFGGPCAVDADIEGALLQHAAEEAERRRVDYLELRATRRFQRAMPTSDHKVSMTIALNNDPEAQWAAFKSKHRTAIRRTYKNDIHVEHGREELLDTFYALICAGWRDLGTPIYRKSYFGEILRRFPEHTRIFVAYQGRKPIAAAFNGYHRGTVEGMWATVVPEARHLQPNYVLYWEMIKHACEQGYRRYHLGRSTAGSNAEQFKRKWNAEPQQLYWHYHLVERKDMPALNVDNPKFKLAIEAWRRLPVRLTQMMGPLLARSIP